MVQSTQSIAQVHNVVRKTSITWASTLTLIDGCKRSHTTCLQTHINHHTAMASSAMKELVLITSAGPAKRWTNLGVLYLLELVLQAGTTACLTIPCHRPVTTTDLGIIDALLDQCTHLFLCGACSTRGTCCQLVDTKAVSLTY